jgi:UDP:flavonoid glycosyltransferase YjiC (YdhE family)
MISSRFLFPQESLKGTVLTSAQDENHGWEGCVGGSSISGKELCQAVFRAVFALLWDAILFSESSQPLIVVSTGPQPDAVSGLTIPTNATCLSSVTQVRLLKKVHVHSDTSLAAVITDGGQNSFMEALSVGVPITVCPGFGDQAANGGKAVSLGVGVKVDRLQKPKTTSNADSVAVSSADSEKERRRYSCCVI